MVSAFFPTGQTANRIAANRHSGCSPLNIDALLQKPGYDGSALPFAITLEACRDSLLRPALETMSALDFTTRPCLCLPIPG